MILGLNDKESREYASLPRGVLQILSDLADWERAQRVATEAETGSPPLRGNSKIATYESAV
jgi:hypothetical protein